MLSGSPAYAIGSAYEPRKELPWRVCVFPKFRGRTEFDTTGDAKLKLAATDRRIDRHLSAPLASYYDAFLPFVSSDPWVCLSLTPEQVRINLFSPIHAERFKRALSVPDTTLVPYLTHVRRTLELKFHQWGE